MDALAAKQGRFPLTIRSVLSCLTLIATFTSGLLIASYPQAIYLLFMALVAAVALLIIGQRAEWGLLLSILLFVVQRSPRLPVVGRLLTVSEVVFVLTSLVWLAQNARKRHRVGVYAPGLLGPFLVCALVGIVSLLNALLSFPLFLWADIELGIAELFARVYLVFFLMVVASYATTASRYRRVLIAWVASAILVVGLTAFFVPIRETGFDPVGLVQDRVLFRALFHYSTGLAGYITGTFLGLLPLALSRRPATAFRLVQTLARCSLPGLLLALVFADSQGAYLAVASGVLAWPFIRLSKRLSLILVVLVLVVSGIVLASVLEFQSPDSHLARMLSAIGYNPEQFPKRIALIESRFQAISDYPIIGVGIGQAGRYTDYLTGRDEGVVSHFTPVGILAETGILGLLAVSVTMMAFLRIMAENTRLDLDGDSGWLQLNEGLTIAFIGMYVFGLAHDIQTNRTLWLILALIVSLKPASFSAASRLSNKG